jgi:hypothetical protein
LFEKKAKKHIKVGTWEYRQIQDYRKRESGWGKALVFYFTILSTKKNLLPSNWHKMADSVCKLPILKQDLRF